MGSNNVVPNNSRSANIVGVSGHALPKTADMYLWAQLYYGSAVTCFVLGIAFYLLLMPIIPNLLLGIFIAHSIMTTACFLGSYTSHCLDQRHKNNSKHNNIYATIGHALATVLEMLPLLILVAVGTMCTASTIAPTIVCCIIQVCKIMNLSAMSLFILSCIGNLYRECSKSDSTATVNETSQENMYGVLDNINIKDLYQLALKPNTKSYPENRKNC